MPLYHIKQAKNTFTNKKSQETFIKIFEDFCKESREVLIRKGLQRVFKTTKNVQFLLDKMFV